MSHPVCFETTEMNSEDCAIWGLFLVLEDHDTFDYCFLEEIRTFSHCYDTHKAQTNSSQNNLHASLSSFYFLNH